MNIRLLWKHAVGRQKQGASERRPGVYTRVHEESSTEVTQLSPPAVEFPNKSIHVTVEQLIHLQRAAEHVSLTHYRSPSSSQAGGYLSRFRGRGMDFDETRGYQPGDDIRFMDWRVMARTGRAHTKLFCEERERPVFIVLDQSLSMRFGSRVTYKSVVAAQAAAILAWAAVKQGDRAGGIVFHDSDFHAIKPRSRKQGVLPLLRQIVRLNNEQPQWSATSQLEHAIGQLHRICNPGALIFIISDFLTLGTTAQQYLRRVSEHSQIIGCFISDPLEQAPPPPGIYQVTHQGKKLQLDTHSAEFCQQYREQYTQHRESVAASLRNQRIPLIDISTQDDVPKTLWQSLVKLRGA